MLGGVQQQLSHQRHLVGSEVGFIKQYAQALSAQAWGSQLSWQPQLGWQCQQEPEKGWQACVVSDAKNEVLMAARGMFPGPAAPLTLWRWGRIEHSQWLSAPHGWLDFCPLAEVSQCLLPQ